MADEADAPIRFELKNSKPVDLLDLTAALSAFGEAYQDYAVSAGYETERGNIKLFVKEIKSGSIIADLISLCDQASFVLRHIDVAAGFVTHFHQLLQYFLLMPAVSAIQPTKREAAQVMSVMEPVAKDGGAQVFFQVHGDVHIHHNYESQQANAIQNNARRFLGPPLPANQVYQDQLLTLFQVRGDPSRSVGDQGIIEALSPAPVKLQFISEETKRQVVELHDNPLLKIFLVDVDVRTADGKPKLYRVLTVKDVLDRS